MSYCEFHKGKLKVLTHNDKETLDYIEQNNLEDVIKECGWCDEIDFDVEDDDYIVLHKDTKCYGDDTEHILCKYLDHEELKDVSIDVCDVKRTGKDEYEFTIGFYNGGTYLGEILSEEISRLMKEEWNPNEDKITISARESYMIKDIIQYALDVTPNHDEYLYCNYSRKELVELAKRFNDLNIKNNW